MENIADSDGVEEDYSEWAEAESEATQAAFGASVDSRDGKMGIALVSP